MRLERVFKNSDRFFNEAFALYESAFPLLERRDEKEQERVLSKDDYHFDLIISEDSFIGIMLYWEVGDIIFLEHFATNESVRGKGYGAKALEKLKEKGKIILLEIEPPVDEMTSRRYCFYKRNGFIMNDVYHIQAKYHKGDKDLELKILSYPRTLTKEEYRNFYEYMIREVSVAEN